MNGVTITIFVSNSSLLTLLTVLKILENLPLENDYVFQPRDIVYSKKFDKDYVQVNLPTETYMKFDFCYSRLVRKAIG